MLQIELFSDNLIVAPSAPHAGYYYVAATRPGTDIDVITFGPEHIKSEARAAERSRTTFHLALQHIYGAKTATNIGSLLPALLQDDDRDIWLAIYKRMRDELPTVTQSGFLDITVCEWLTATMPRANPTRPEVDDLIRQGLRNMSLSTTTPGNNQIPTALLASRRIGHIYISSGDLARIFLSGLQHDLVYPLYDVNAPDDQPVARGTLLLRITPDSSNTSRALESVLRRLAPGLLPAFLQAGAACNGMNAAYIHQYIRAFPAFDSPFANVAASYGALKFLVHNDATVTIPMRFVPDKNDMNDIHMPTGRIDGQPAPIPIHLLFSSVSKSSEHTETHNDFYGQLFDTYCALFGTTPTRVAAAIHALFDRTNSSPNVDILAAWRIVSATVTFASSVLTYRSDVVLDTDGHIRACEDIARDAVTGVTNSCDCEDSAFCIHAVYATLLQGSAHLDSATTWQDRDSLWTNVYRPSGFRGGWQHVGLDAIQRLLAHMPVVTILGTVSAAFPGDRERAPATTIRDLDNAERLYSTVEGQQHAHAREVGRYMHHSQANRMSKSEAHRWCVAIPLKSLVETILKTAESEQRVGTVRHPADLQAIERLKKLNQSIERFPGLPSVTLEGTTPTDPFCVVGASHWLNDSDNELKAKLRAIEAKARALTVEFRERIQPQWYLLGGEQFDCGAYRHLPGNLPDRIGSQFYSRALQLDAWIVGELTKSTDMVTYACTHGIDGARWGVPINMLLLTDKLLHLVPTTHRIAYNLRQEYNQQGRLLQSCLLPCSRLGSVNVLELAQPVPTMATEAFGLRTFEQSLYYLRGDMGTSEQQLERYKRDLASLTPTTTTTTTIVEYKMKPLTMCHSELIYSVHNL